MPDFRMEARMPVFSRRLPSSFPFEGALKEDIRATIEAKNYAALNTMVYRLQRCPAVDAMRKCSTVGGKEVCIGCSFLLG